MASWLQVALKAVIPHVGDILSAAKPAFTKQKPLPAANQRQSVRCAPERGRTSAGVRGSTEPALALIIKIMVEQSRLPP